MADATDGSGRVDVTDVTVIGAGAMGHGLAVQFSLAGLDVTLVDHRRENVERARDRIEDAATFLVEHGLTDQSSSTLVDRVSFGLDATTAVEGTGVVLETITEELAAKRRLFETVAPAAPAHALLLSNTSSIPITDVAQAVPDHAGRVAGCHWWYPPYLLTPVEVVRGEATTDDTVERLCSFVESVDRDPVLVERDVPGFVWNRVQFAVVRECLHLVEAGVASAADVNRAIRDGYATRTAAIGPLETVDIAGLELFETIASDLYPALATDDEPQALFADLLDDGRSGIQAGAGFFEYDDPPENVTRRRDERVAAIRQALESSTE